MRRDFPIQLTLGCRGNSLILFRRNMALARKDRMRDKHKFPDGWGLQDVQKAPREKTTDLSRTHGRKTCSFWERERSSIWAAANCHFPARKLVASSYSSAFPSSKFPMSTGRAPVASHVSSAHLSLALPAEFLNCSNLFSLHHTWFSNCSRCIQGNLFVCR